MADEMINLLKVCIIVSVCLTYCYSLSSRISKGYTRLVSLLPIISIFTFIPFLFSSVVLQFYSGAFIAWQANFKLLLLAFGRDDTLSVNPSVSLLHFIVLTTFPVKIKPNQQPRTSESSKKPKIRLSSLNPLCLCASIQLYATYKQYAPVSNPAIIHFLHTCRLFFGIQVYFAFVGAIAKLLLKQELEPQFDEPLLPTSLQNFWGKRWNRMFSGVLKSTIQEPTRTLFTPLLGKQWAMRTAIIATFLVSGLMHDLNYFYVGRQKPSWEATLYFLMHGVLVVAEVEVKKTASERGWKLHPLISRSLVSVFLAVTTTWWCFAQLVHCGADEREIDEYIAFGDYVKQIFY